MKCPAGVTKGEHDMNEFTINNTNYTSNGKGYFYKEQDGKKIRIKKDEYEQAWDEYMTTLNDQADADEWQAEADAELEAREKAQAESDKQAEDAVNGKTKKARKPRKSKDIAFEMNSYDDDLQKTTITLTAKQVAFIKRMPEDDFYEHGLDSTLWIDVFCDTVADQFNPMAVGAMVSTLREKNIFFTSEQKVNGKKSKYIGFTEFGKVVAKALGLN